MQQIVQSETGRLMGWRALAIWTAATILGEPIVYFLPQVVLALVDVRSWIGVLLYAFVGAISGAIAGTVVGVLQRLVMPTKGPWVHRWLRATVLGWAVGGGVLFLVSWSFYFWQAFTNDASSFVAVVIILGFSGAAIGLGQTVAFKQPRAAIRWIFVGGGAWAVAAVAGWGLSQALLPVSNSNNYLNTVTMLFILVGATVGLITGLAMNRLITQFARQETNI